MCLFFAGTNPLELELELELDTTVGRCKRLRSGQSRLFESVTDSLRSYCLASSMERSLRVTTGIRGHNAKEKYRFYSVAFDRRHNAEAVAVAVHLVAGPRQSCSLNRRHKVSDENRASSSKAKYAAAVQLPTAPMHAVI